MESRLSFETQPQTYSFSHSIYVACPVELVVGGSHTMLTVGQQMMVNATEY